jgi:hypothetical protein
VLSFPRSDATGFLAAVVALLSVAGCAARAPSATPLDGVDEPNFSLQATYLYGPANGFVQTPSGGEPGTTSRKRPRLDEVGIDDASIADAEGRARWGPQEAYAGGQWVRLAGEDTLADDLISQGRTFPAASDVSSDVKLDWYRVGYRYRFEWDDRSTGRPVFTLAPGVGADLLDFGYTLDGTSGGERADRSYIKAGAQLGLEADWHITNRWSLVADTLCSVPIPNTPFIVKADLTARYRLLTRRRWDVTALAGIGYERIEYEDDQTVPNHVQVDFGPMLVVGLNVRF